jgi:hypothetical protein
MKSVSKGFMTIAAAAALVAASASVSHAGPAWEFTSAGESFNNNTWDFGAIFTVTSTVTVSGLGYYADPNNGQVASNPVNLYSCADAACATTGSLLASAIVTNAFPLQDHFRYVTIAPITLTPGAYEVDGVSFGDNYTWNDPGFSTDPSITYVANSDVWQLDSSPDFMTAGTNGGDVTDGYWGPDIFLGVPTFTGAVPEPGTLSLLAVGFAGIGLVRRRKTHQA